MGAPCFKVVLQYRAASLPTEPIRWRSQRTFIAFDKGERNPIAIDFPVHFPCSQKKDKKRAVMGTVI